MKKLVIISSTIAMLLLSGCTTTGPTTTANGGAAEAIAAAEALYAKAKKEGVAWRKTHEIIAESKELLAASKKDEAIAMANRAKVESEIALQESAEYDKTWAATVPK